MGTSIVEELSKANIIWALLVAMLQFHLAAKVSPSTQSDVSGALWSTYQRFVRQLVFHDSSIFSFPTRRKQDFIVTLIEEILKQLACAML
ncbi:hypothetical protein VTP01DRAFT_9536 [Rhizomucor pusillus]|uniref:uncharacterized protein n=1 Tax=Rhizomucor pusillus TaxID=4840 RepID=UPI0037430FB0